MTAQELANALAPLLGRIEVPMTAQNAQATLAIYETLGAMARGQLILVKPSEDQGNGPAT